MVMSSLANKLLLKIKEMVTWLFLVCSALGLTQAQTNHSGSAFPCQIPTPSNDTTDSVHLLRPSDIRVIGAMGDSLTAGFGALMDFSNFFVVPIDYRGLSWSGGKSTLDYCTTTYTFVAKLCLSC